MSKQSLESAIGKAILDIEFRNTLFAFPDEALADFDLSAAEKNMLKRVDCETLELLAKTLNMRLGKIPRNSLKMDFHTNTYKTGEKK